MEKDNKKTKIQDNKKKEYKGQFIECKSDGFGGKYGWNFLQKMIAWTLFIVIIWATLSFVNFTKPKDDLDHGFKYLGVAPKEANPFFEKSAIPSGESDSEDVIKYAMKLYAAGNMGMLYADYSGMFLKGVSNSTTMGMDIPLIIEAVEIRDNKIGEYTKYRKQVCDTTKADNGTLLIGKLGAELAEIRHYMAGDEKVTYFKTTAFFQDEKYEPDWSKKTGASLIREEIYTTPTALTSAATLTAPAEIAVDGYCYKLVNGKYYPYHVNAGGIEMSYEITDQHFAWLENSASSLGNEFEEDFFKTIQSATVKHNDAGGYYEVELVMNTKKEYSTYDTIWAIRDAEGANSQNARYKKINLSFKLWDNGYFKEATLSEYWECKNAKPHGISVALMKADQSYNMQFTYDKTDCDNTRFKYWE